MAVMRINHGRIKAGTWPEFQKAFREAVKRAGKVDGLLGRSLSQDRKDPDVGYAISMWSSMEAADAYSKSELATVLEPMLKPYFTGDFRTDYCDVCYWDFLHDVTSSEAE